MKMKSFAVRLLCTVLAIFTAFTAVPMSSAAGEEPQPEIEIASMPSKTEYYIGEMLDTSGLVLNVVNPDGSVETVTGGFVCNPTVFETSGVQEVTVNYEGLSCSFKVSVLKASLSKITVNTLPKKTVYQVGETFDKTGMTVNVTYSSGKVAVVSAGFSCEPTKFNSVGVQTVTVHYGNKTCTFEVEVIERDLTATYISDGRIYKKFVGFKTGDSVPVPANPEKEGFAFVGWTPSIPDEFSALSMTFTALFESGESDIRVNLIGDFEYSGKPVEPEVDVRDSETDEVLTENEDYTVAYRNNINYGAACVTVTGKGDYSGEVFTTFNILPVSESELTVQPIPDISATGLPLSPVPYITFGDEILTYPEDFTVEYSDNVTAGKAKAAITFKGNYSGTAEAEFNIVESEFSAILAENSVEYTTPFNEIGLSVYDGEKLLAENADYTVEYPVDSLLGLKTVTVKGMGRYEGSTALLCITVVPCDISGSKVELDTVYTYSAAPIEPDVTLSINGVALTKDKDYTVAYENNTDAGLMTVIINGVDRFIGEIRKNVSVVPADINSVEIKGLAEKYIYSGQAVKPAVDLVYEGVILESGKDYSVTYSNNVECGQASMTFLGLGNFSGTRTLIFDIEMPVQTSVKINNPVDTLKYEEQVQLTAAVTLADGVEAQLVWTSSDESVAAVDSEGNVTALDEGTAVITAALVDADGNPVTDSEGNEYKDSFELSCTMNIFQKIIRWFKNLFSFLKFW